MPYTAGGRLLAVRQRSELPEKKSSLKVVPSPSSSPDALSVGKRNDAIGSSRS